MLRDLTLAFTDTDAILRELPRPTRSRHAPFAP
jgi:hypothetical protein